MPSVFETNFGDSFTLCHQNYVLAYLSPAAFGSSLTLFFSIFSIISLELCCTHFFFILAFFNISYQVIETEPEPEHTVVEDTTRQLELLVSAKVDYASYECSTSTITFKDTLMFQSRIYE